MSVLPGNKIIQRSSVWLKYNDYFNILVNYKQYKDLWTLTPLPNLPQPGEIYLYVAESESKTVDWKYDKIQWRYNSHRKVPAKNPILNCHYFTVYHGSGFSKRAYCLITDDEGFYSNATVIHYIGSLQNVEYQKHGNRKHGEHIFHITTARSTREALKKELMSTPLETYKKYVEKIGEDPRIDPVLKPRNLKQVENLVNSEKEKKLLDKDDLVGLYYLTEVIPNFIQAYALYPHFYAVIGSNEGIEIFIQMNDQLKNASTLYYDTTFNLGDFYV